MAKKDELKKEIEELREKLNQQGRETQLTKEELIEISHKLDRLINEYYD